MVKLLNSVGRFDAHDIAQRDSRIADEQLRRSAGAVDASHLADDAGVIEHRTAAGVGRVHRNRIVAIRRGAAGVRRLSQVNVCEPDEVSPVVV